MEGQPTDFWGKFEQRDGTPRWHPLIDHSADVAAVCEALLRRTLLATRLAQIGNRDQLTETDIQRLCALAAFHDVGKFNLGFQNKAFPDRKPGPEGHVGAVLSLLNSRDSRLLKAMPLADIEQWAEDNLGLELLVAAIAHHGKPVELDGSPNLPVWQTDAYGRDPFAGIRRLSNAVRRWFPEAFSESARPLPSSPPFQHAFCGLVTLADWLGSDERHFPYSEALDTDRLAFARQKASQALAQIGLDPQPARKSLATNRPAQEILALPGLNNIQQKIQELPTNHKGSLVILESETGSGKTEAAFIRFLHLFEQGLVDGMYFALPTRTAASQIHQRIARFICAAFPDEATRPPVILAVPGYIPLDDEPAPYLLAQFESLWADEGRFRFLSWAAEHPKRYLAGAISVGTVDQALLSALAVSHSHLRATSLLRQFLVVDEVHASDAYMTVVLHEVLRFHLAAGGHAMLLSATLGSRAATELLAAAQSEYNRPASKQAKAPSFEDAKALPYPLITAVAPDHPSQSERIPVDTDSPARTVSVALEPIAAELTAVASKALQAARDGARVIVVRNTVADCVATQLALEDVARAQGLNHLLFNANDLFAPHHSRYAAPDRKLLDRRLEASFGRRSSSPCVVCATQTIQQSLDLDADFMITDLCPMDVLLQRIGRLHRHRRPRPPRFSTPQIIVLVPAEQDLSRFIDSRGQACGPHGLGTVYEDLRIIEATWRELRRNPVLELPRMNRELVEAATHPQALEALVDELVKALPRELGERWRAHRNMIHGIRAAKNSLAYLNIVDREEPLYECKFPTDLDSRVRTRLGEDDRIAAFPNMLRSPFGFEFQRISVPGWLVPDAPKDEKTKVLEEKVLEEKDGYIRFIFANRHFCYNRLGLSLVGQHSDEGALWHD